MPQDFPDMQSLIFAAEIHKFRSPRDSESEANYRAALANHVADRNFLESEEIRRGKGWDKFSDNENLAMLHRGILMQHNRAALEAKLARPFFRHEPQGLSRLTSETAIPTMTGDSIPLVETESIQIDYDHAQGIAHLNVHVGRYTTRLPLSLDDRRHLAALLLREEDAR